MKRYISTLMLIFGFISATLAQLNPLGGIYYQNQYLANPALVGVNLDWELSGNYKAQWTAIEGAPAMQALTLAYGAPSKKVGVGFYFYNENAGAINRTSAKLSYGYHLILNSQQTSFIDFGISVGLMNEWIDFKKIKGDLSDVSLLNFNQRETFLDGDFGVAFRTKQLTIQAAFPNLKRLLEKDVSRAIVDRTTYMMAASYKFSNETGATTIEPKVAYRGIKNFKEIFDAGLNIGLNENKLNFTGVYHSTNSVTLGIGTLYQKQLSIQCQYTTNTADLQGYSNSEFEIGLKYSWK